MMQSQGRQRVLAWAKICWILVVLAGVTYYLWHNGQQIVATLGDIPALNLLSALACVLCGKFAALYLMRASLQLQGDQLTGWRDHLWIYASSDLAKYMPGGIWAIVGRVVHYRHFGTSAVAISKALLLENMGLAITALLLAVPVGLMLFAVQGWSLALFATLVCLLAVLGLPVAARQARRLDFMGFRGKTLRIILGALGVMLLGWVAMGTSFFLLLPEYNTIHYWLWSIGSYATAFIVGMTVVFAPAGAGVREGLLALAGQFIGIPTTVMLNAAILNRAIWVVADLCVFSFALFVRLFGK